MRAQHYAVLTRCCAHSPQEFAQALGEDRALGVYRAWLARKHVRGDSQNFDDGEARKGADVDGTSGDVLAARAATGALACLRLASCGDGQALLADLDGALTLVNEAVRRGPGASLRRSPRVADRATLETPVDADDATMELPLDALCAWRAELDWARGPGGAGAVGARGRRGPRRRAGRPGGAGGVRCGGLGAVGVGGVRRGLVFNFGRVFKAGAAARRRPGVT